MTMRAGESSVVSLGASVPFALNSTRSPSWLRATSSRSSCAPAAVPLPVMSAAEAIITNASSGTIRPSSCFRISLSPHARPLRLHVYRQSRFSGLHRRRCNLLHYFPCERLSQPVLHRLLEHDRVAGDLHDVAVKYRIVLVQKIRFIQAVADHRNKARIGANHTLEADGANLQALLARTATGPAAAVGHHGAQEGIPSAVGVVLFFRRRRIFRVILVCGSA